MPIDISENIKKLFDHTSLDIARMNYSDAGDEKISKSEVIHKMNSQIKELKDNLSNAKTKLEKEEEKLNSMQKEYITILGIFAAVVIAFVGEMAFSTSVLENVHNLGDIFTIIVVIAMVGLSFANILFSLFYFVGKLVKDDGIVNNGIWKTMNIVGGIIIFASVLLHFLLEHNAMRWIIVFFKELVKLIL